MSIGNSPDGNSSEDERPFEDTPEGERPSIGSVLREARLAAGLTVDDVSGATRVRIAIVQAIEQDNFAACGGDVYARGHIRTLARAVDIDPAPLLEQFAAAHGGLPAPTPAAPLFEAERIRPERRGPNWTAAMVAAIVVVVAFVGFTLFNDGDSDNNSTTQVAGSTPSANKSPTPKSSPSKSEAPKPEASDSAIAAAPRDKVTVKISAVDGRSWISVKDHNGRSLFDDTLNAGDSKTFTDQEQIDLVLGNAGAIQLYVNGKKIEDQFQPGQVERLSYTKGDPEAG